MGHISDGSGGSGEDFNFTYSSNSSNQVNVCDIANTGTVYFTPFLEFGKLGFPILPIRSKSRDFFFANSK